MSPPTTCVLLSVFSSEAVIQYFSSKSINLKRFWLIFAFYDNVRYKKKKKILGAVFKSVHRIMSDKEFD